MKISSDTQARKCFNDLSIKDDLLNQSLVAFNKFKHQQAWLAENQQT